MKKDIIYIDVEDDITAIIGKVKASKEKIVALVPPKRIGVLQSAVNLRLLQRTATQDDKHLVLITGNQALAGLAAAASIPVARNLQSKPEVAEIPALDIDDGEDIIDGSQLPIGDHAKQAAARDETDTKEADLIKGVDIENEAPVAAAPVARRAAKKASLAKRVPNFNTFRKKLIIAGIVGVLLIAGLVWAIVFAPAATVIITARTTAVPVNGVVTLGKETSAEQGIIKVITESIEKSDTVDFEATGEKEVGDKASGSVVFSNCETYTSQVIKAGTFISTGQYNYSVQDDVVVPGGSGSFLGCTTPGVSPAVKVVAQKIGDGYNAAAGTQFAVAGSSSQMKATTQDGISGGTSKTVPMVTAADVQAAKEKLVEQSTDAVKKELESKFTGDVKVIDASFDVKHEDATSKPAIGDEATDKKATLTSKATYQLSGIANGELTAYLEQTLKQQMQDQTAQRIYSSGADSVALNDYVKRDESASVRIATTGQIGPTIDETNIKEKVAGKRFGEIQSELTKIDGVSDVDVKFSFFWVRTVPNNLNKITIKFDVQNADK